jgi:hypothetical protein
VPGASSHCYARAADPSWHATFRSAPLNAASGEGRGRSGRLSDSGVDGLRSCVHQRWIDYVRYASDSRRMLHCHPRVDRRGRWTLSGMIRPSGTGPPNIRLEPSGSIAGFLCFENLRSKWRTKGIVMRDVIVVIRPGQIGQAIARPLTADMRRTATTWCDRMLTWSRSPFGECTRTASG